MKVQNIHAFYQDPKDVLDFLPGWGYDLRLRKHDGNVTICVFTEGE